MSGRQQRVMVQPIVRNTGFVATLILIFSSLGRMLFSKIFNRCALAHSTFTYLFYFLTIYLSEDEGRHLALRQYRNADRGPNYCT